MSSAEQLTKKIMDEVLTELDARLNYISDYKKDMGIDIPYSKTSAKYQEGIKNFFIRDIAKERQASPENAQDIFENNLKDGMVFDYFSQKGEKEKTEFIAMRRNAFSAPDAETKKKLSQEFNDYSQQIFESIPPEQKSDFTDTFMKNLLLHHHANNKMRSELNASLKTNEGYNTEIDFEKDHGYCLKSIVTSLYDANKKYGCLKFLPQDIEQAVHPKTFVDELKKNETHAKHLFATDENNSLRDLIEKNDIQKGAIVMLCGEDGKPRHAMFYNGEKDENGEPLISGFNSEDKGILASKSPNGKKRQGIIVDVHALISEDIQQMFPKNYLSSVRQKLTPQTTETTTNNQSTQSPLMALCRLQQKQLD